MTPELKLFVPAMGTHQVALHKIKFDCTNVTLKHYTTFVTVSQNYNNVTFKYITLTVITVSVSITLLIEDDTAKVRIKWWTSGSISL
jgi:hypothetical protein